MAQTVESKAYAASPLARRGAITSDGARRDCFVAALLAMTAGEAWALALTAAHYREIALKFAYFSIFRTRIGAAKWLIRLLPLAIVHLDRLSPRWAYASPEGSRACPRSSSAAGWW